MITIQQAKHLTQLIDMMSNAKDNYVQALCMGSSGSMSSAKQSNDLAATILTDYIISLVEK